MKRIIAAAAATVAALVLLFSYRTSLGDTVVALPGSVARVASSGQPGAVATTAGSDPPPQPAAAATLGPDTTGSGTTTGSAVVDGATEQTPYGPVQVELTVTSGRITQVTVLQQPTAAFRSQQINAFALPQLRTETLAAQSARIDAVSGATYTTEGYRASLQSALDTAHLTA